MIERSEKSNRKVKWRQGIITKKESREVGKGRETKEKPPKKKDISVRFSLKKQDQRVKIDEISNKKIKGCYLL